MEVPRFRPVPNEEHPESPDPLTLLSGWWRAVGGPMARVASPRGVVRRRLLVSVPDARWKRQVGEHLDEILARLRRMEGLEGLEGIDLAVEPELGAGAVSPAGGAGAPDPGPAGDIALSAGAIPDGDLARRWVAAVSRILARRRGSHDS